MALFQIPGPESSDASFIEFGAVLEQVEYQFTLQWLPRTKFWLIAVIDAQREPVLRGQRCVTGIDLLSPYSDARLPPGRLIIHDSQNRWSHPGRNDWQERHALLYDESVTPVRTVFTRELTVIA